MIGDREIGGEKIPTPRCKLRLITAPTVERLELWAFAPKVLRSSPLGATGWAERARNMLICGVFFLSFGHVNSHPTIRSIALLYGPAAICQFFASKKHGKQLINSLIIRDSALGGGIPPLAPPSFAGPPEIAPLQFPNCSHYVVNYRDLIAEMRFSAQLKNE